MSRVLWKPLVVIGPAASGKSTLINHLRYNKPERFTYVLNHTSRTEFRKEEAEGHDYLSSPTGDAMFEDEGIGPNGEPMWLFKAHTPNLFGRSAAGAMAKKGTAGFWTGCLYSAAAEAQRDGKIALLKVENL